MDDPRISQTERHGYHKPEPTEGECVMSIVVVGPATNADEFEEDVRAAIDFAGFGVANVISEPELNSY